VESAPQRARGSFVSENGTRKRASGFCWGWEHILFMKVILDGARRVRGARKSERQLKLTTNERDNLAERLKRIFLAGEGT